MSIKSKTEKKKIILEIDNGDLEKLTQCMANWKFKDHQSFLRFAMSLLIVTEDKSLWINVVDAERKFKGMLFREDFRGIFKGWHV